jgi:hypothetical protein
MIIGKTQYQKLYKNESQRKKALKTALEIRKFELELYWKRATYYWTFIAGAFAAYFLICKIEKSNIADLLTIVSCLGFVFSIAWYLANRGSKYWTANWELHVDYLEDDFQGPLYKTVLDRKQFNLRDWERAYPFSVAKINQVLNLYVSVIWLFLIFHSISLKFNLLEPFKGFNILVLCIISIIAINFHAEKSGNRS